MITAYPTSLAYKVKVKDSCKLNSYKNIKYAFRGNLEMNNYLNKNVIIYIEENFNNKGYIISFDHDSSKDKIKTRLKYVINTPEPKEFFKTIKLIPGHKIIS